MISKIQWFIGRVDAWRWFAGVSLLMAIIRGTGYFASLDLALTALQFGSLILALLALWLAPGRRDSFSRVQAIALAFGLLALVGSIWSPVPLTTLTRSVLFALLLLVAFETARIRWVDKVLLQRDIVLLFWAVVTFTAIGFLLALFQVPEMWGDYNRFKGLTVNATVLAWIATILFPIGYWSIFTASGRYRYLLIAANGLLVLAVVLSGTRGALVALLVAVVLVHVLGRKNYLFGSMSALIVTAGIAFTFFAPQLFGSAGSSVPDVAPESSPGPDNTAVPQPAETEQPEVPPVGRQGESATDISSGRFDLWLRGLALLKQRPVGGWGFGSTSELHGFTGGTSMSLHNAYLTTLLETGFLGALLLGALFVVIFFWRQKPRWAGVLVAATVVLINGIFESSLVNLGSPVTIISWLVIGALYASGRKDPRADLDGNSRNVSVPSGQAFSTNATNR